MKIKMRKTEGTLNPMPVMGKDAFVAFAKEWSQYLTNLGKSISIQITIPSPFEFRRYQTESAIYVAEKIATMNGTCSNPYEFKQPHSNCSFLFRSNEITRCTPRTHPHENVFTIDSLADFDISNIVFERLRIPHPDDSQKLKEIIEKTRQMIYERSALVHRGLFGGFYIE